MKVNLIITHSFIQEKLQPHLDESETKLSKEKWAGSFYLQVATSVCHM